MHVLQQAASLKVVAKKLSNIHYNPPGCVFAHRRRPHKQHIFHYTAGQPADDLYAEFSAIVANLQSHQAITVSLDEFQTRALQETLSELNKNVQRRVTRKLAGSR